MRLTGRVKWFQGQYGFITPPDSSRSEELFVHERDVEVRNGYRTLMAGETVEFEPIDTPRGRKAVKVCVVEGE
jgi:cold shock CspA family protein